MTAEPTLALRDEYLDAKLRCAARVVWLRVAHHEPYEPPEEWIANEAENLRDVLRDGEPKYSNDSLRWYVLGLLGIRQSYASSSARVERREPEAVADFDPAPVTSGMAG